MGEGGRNKKDRKIAKRTEK